MMSLICVKFNRFVQMAELPELSDLPRASRRSACVILMGQTASKLADIACNAKTVLTWLMGVVGAPVELTALLVPIRESGSMLPQAFVSGLVKRASRRKWVYVVGALGQTGALVAMAAAAVFLEGVSAGLAVLLALSLYAVARCFCSIASKDVIGKALPKGTRGRLTGMAAAISGVIGLVVALAGNVWTWPSLFFLLSLGYSGVRIGRKTYVVDVAEGDTRTDYVSVSNTLIALLILIMGAMGSLFQMMSPAAALAFFSALCLLGGLFSYTLRDASVTS